MTQPVRDMLIGLVSAIAVIGFSALLFLFGELDPIFNPRYLVNVTINNAGGLRPGSLVELNGVQVGIVEDVVNQLEADRARLVHIRALVQRHVE
ncbi:MAG: MlaD family protein, partial [Planctomycetota bacterium]